ncbi:MAG: ATP-binding protein, partial [Burkholderiaceae bacterium]
MSGWLRRSLALLATALALALALWLWLPQPLPPGVLVLDTASFVKSDAPAPPDTGPLWVPRTLPDDWRRNLPGQHGYGWYRLTFELDTAPADSWGVYLSRVSTTYQLFVNGIEVGSGGGMSGEIRRLAGRPQFDLVPPHILQPGRNELLLRLRVASNLRGGLGQLTLGPRHEVEAIYERADLLRVALPRAVNLALLFSGLLVGLLWLRRPQETIYGYFAALAVLWSLRNFHYTFAPAGLPSVLWESFVLGSLGVVLLLVWRFILRFTGQRMPRWERLLSWCFGLAPLAFPLLGEQRLSQIRIGWYLCCAGLGVLAIAALARHLRTPTGRAHRGAWLILGATCLTLLLGLTDLAVSAGLLPFGPAARMAFGAPLLLTSLVVAVADNYFDTFAQARMRNAELEQRVLDRTHALRQAQGEMEALARAHAVSQERERLMRDMHDGVGSQLMTTLAAVERDELDSPAVAELLRDCIADLRLVIDSLEPDESSLRLALANLRYRMEPQLQAAGIGMQWSVPAAPTTGPAIPPGTVLQVLRIVQEALVNAIRHSGARRLRVALFEHEGGLQIEVGDDGRGLPATALAEAPVSAQRGLGNL